MSAKSKPVILVVDDEESIRRNLREYLQDEGFDVQTAESGEEALDLLPLLKPDLAVVDIRLPGMDGNAFIMEAHRLCPSMRFLVFTGSIEYSLPPELQAMGLAEEHVLRKPLQNLSVMSERIEMQIGTRSIRHE